eukprot:TCONS_00050887-protein
MERNRMIHRLILPTLILLSSSQGKTIQNSQESSTSASDLTNLTEAAATPQRDTPGRVPWFAMQKKSLPFHPRFMFSRDADSAKNDERLPFNRRFMFFDTSVTTKRDEPNRVPWFAKQKKSLPFNPRFMFSRDSLPFNHRFMFFDSSSALKNYVPNRVPWFAKQKKSFETNDGDAPNRIPWFASRQKKDSLVPLTFKDVPNIVKDNKASKFSFKRSDITIPITEYYYSPGPENLDRYIPPGVVNHNRLSGFKDTGKNLKSKDGKKPRMVIFGDAVSSGAATEESSNHQEEKGKDHGILPPNFMGRTYQREARSSSKSSSSIPLSFIRDKENTRSLSTIPLTFINKKDEPVPNKIPWFAVKRQKKSLAPDSFEDETNNDEDGESKESRYPLFLYKDASNSFADFLTTAKDQPSNQISSDVHRRSAIRQILTNQHQIRRREDSQFPIRCGNVSGCDKRRCINGICRIVCSNKTLVCLQ